MNEELRNLVDYLRENPDERKLVHDEAEHRWFIYDFVETPPEVTSVAKELVGELIERRWVEDEGEENRAQFPGDDYSVMRLRVATVDEEYEVDA